MKIIILVKIIWINERIIMIFQRKSSNQANKILIIKNQFKIKILKCQILILIIKRIRINK